MVLIISSCATKKRKGEVGGFKKFYHNVTAKYNGLFNANEIMEETMDGIEDNHQDNFSEILPVYTYVDVDPNGIKDDMDKVIEKVTTVATIHDVSNYVDDCYVMLGRAQFLKQDYESAEETFEFFQGEFNPNDPASRNYKKKTKSSLKQRKKMLHAPEEKQHQPSQVVAHLRQDAAATLQVETQVVQQTVKAQVAQRMVDQLLMHPIQAIQAVQRIQMEAAAVITV